MILGAAALAAAISYAVARRRGAAGGGAAGATVPGGAAQADGDTVFPLQYGSDGNEVYTLQTIMRALHIYDEDGNDLQPDGIWGPHTEHAAAKLPRFAYYRNDGLATMLHLQSAWHRPFENATRTVSGRTTIPKAGYETITAFYSQNRKADGLMDLGATKII